MINYLIQDSKRPGVSPTHYIVCSFDKNDDEYEILREIQEMFPHAILPGSPPGAIGFTRLLGRGSELCQINIRGLTKDDHMLFKLKWGLKNVFI